MKVLGSNPRGGSRSFEMKVGQVLSKRWYNVGMQKERKCIKCHKLLVKRHQVKYCSNKCQLDHRYLVNISMWKNNNSSSIYLTKNISHYIKRYLIEKFGEKCTSCGWNKKNETSGKIPLEVDHIDGNARNNSEKNLRLLCPNCHSLTPYFRNLNKGNGRSWRIKKVTIDKLHLNM